MGIAFAQPTLQTRITNAGRNHNGPSMTEAHASTRISRIIKARPEALYAAFMDPDALVAWLPPGEMTGKLHTFDGRVGGGYRMSLFYPPGEQGFRGKTAERED